MRKKVIGWLYGSVGADSMPMRMAKASLAMLSVYTVGVLGYVLLLCDILEFS